MVWHVLLCLVLYSGEIPAEICVSSTVWWPNDQTLVEFQSYFPNLHKENPTEKGTSSDYDFCLIISSHQGFGAYLKLYSYLQLEISPGSNNSNAYDLLSIIIILNFCLVFIIS